jgi:transposase
VGGENVFRTSPWQVRKIDLSDFLLVEAAQVPARSIPECRHKYFHLAMRRGRKIAKVAMARRLAVQLFWMWRKGWDYEQGRKCPPHAGITAGSTR